MSRYLAIFSIFAVALFGINLESSFTYTFDVNKQYDMVQAEDLYLRNKYSICHGDNARKNAAGSRVLKDMSPEDIKVALAGCILDGSTPASASQMAFYVRNLNYDDMDNITAYIKGENFVVDLQVKDLLEEGLPRKTKHNIFSK